jgi:hypothetical protein
MLLDRARVSHAAASHFHPDFSILMNAVHLLAKEFWVGGLMALGLILLPILHRIARGPWIAITLASMSKYISIALGIDGDHRRLHCLASLKEPGLHSDDTMGISLRRAVDNGGGADTVAAVQHVVSGTICGLVLPAIDQWLS